jgi:hypothetical protein
MALKYLYVPSGVNTGKAYGVLPNSSDADFDDFARSSAGSRVDKNGLINTGLGLGSEQVVDGDFDNPSSWDTTVATISNGRAIFIDGTGAYSRVAQEGVLTQNKKYEVTIDVVINSGSGFKIQDGNGNTYKQITESGVYTFRFTSEGLSSSLFIARNLVDVPYDMYVESVSVKEIIDANTDLPRLDYTGGGCPSLLLEPEATNYIQHSENFSQSYWTKSNCVVTSTDNISPEGINNATLITDNNAGGTGAVTLNKYNFSLPSAGSYTYSIFVKKGTRKIIRLTVSLYGFTPSSESGVYFDLDLGEVNSVIGSPLDDYGIEHFGDGWYRLFISFTIDGTDLSGFVRVQMQADNLQNTLNLDGTNSVYVYGAQVEKLPYATSYIPNYGISAGTTRSGDNAGSTGDIANEINEEEGVFFAYMAAHTSEPLDTPQWLTLSEDSLSDSFIALRYSNTGDSIQVRYQANGGSAVQINTTTIDRSNFNKIAFRWKANDFSLWINGNLIETNTTLDIITTNNLNTLKFSNMSGGQRLYAKVKEIRIYDKYESNSVMAELTTL